MDNWNAQFTQMVRGTYPAYWGNWSLSPDIVPGAVGILDPVSGTFRLVTQQLNGLTPANTITSALSSDWNMMTSTVSRKETKVSLDGSAVDPESGTKITAGVQVDWTMGKSGDMVSQCALDSTTLLNNIDTVLNAQYAWLNTQAGQCGMSSSRGISQGFGVITNVVYARSGLNVASQADDNTFSLVGSVSGVNELLGEAKGQGSYVSANSTKSTDKHLWPADPGKVAAGTAPIAFSFASFDGNLLLPRWITNIGAYQLVLRNNHGGTYVVKASLGYDCSAGRQTQNTSVSGGLTASFGSIPLDATNIDLNLEFVCVGANEKKSFHWPNPRGEWITGMRHVDLYGVWPGQTRAVDAEAGINLN